MGPPGSTSELSKTYASAALSAVSTCSSTAPGGALAVSGMAWRTAAMTSFIICRSSMLRLPGSRCSIVSLTSGAINLAHVVKNTVGCRLPSFPWRRDHARPRPRLGLQKALAEYGAATNRSAIRVARDTRWPHPAIHMFAWLKSHFFCFLLLICAQGSARWRIAATASRRSRPYCPAAAGLPVPNTMTFAPIGVRL